MTDREKLIELLDWNSGYTPEIPAGEMADDLISNGVVVREKGEWVENHMRAIFSCSLCGCEIYDRRIYRWEQYPPENFCPNCGADMRKGENG